MEPVFANVQAGEDGKLSLETNLPFTELYFFLAQTLRQMESGELALPPEE